LSNVAISEETMSSSANTTRCPAKLRGEAVPGFPWEGQAVSVFSRAVNLLSGEHRLVSLVIDELQMTEFSVLLEALPPVEEGHTVRGDAESLRFSRPGSKEGSVAVIDLSGTEFWSGRLPAIPVQDLSPRLPEILAHRLLRSGKAEGLADLAAGGMPEGGEVPPAGEGLLVQRARKVLAAVAGAAENGGFVDLSGLIGLGIGFTPSGDDFIVGALAAEDLLQRGFAAGAPAPSGVPQIDRNRIAERSAATTYGGAALLRAAAGGSYSALIIMLLQLLFEARPPEGRTGSGPAHPAPGRGDSAEKPLERRCAEAVRLAETYGETSGIDSLTGIWWYLRQFLSGGSRSGPEG
jgi:hypothetical protein